MSRFQHPPGGPPPLPPFQPKRWLRREPLGPTPDERLAQTKSTLLANREWFDRIDRIEHETLAAYNEVTVDVFRRLYGLLLGKGDMKPLTVHDENHPAYIQAEDHIDGLMKRLTDELQNAELTVNFRADQWFARENTAESYTQMFERHPQTYGEVFQRDVAKSTQSGDPSHRAQFEEQKLVPPPALTRGSLNLVANAPNRFSQTGGMSQVGEDWVPNNPNFIGASRPRYAGLNYTGDRNGACAAEGDRYGYSVLVWKPDLKTRASFSAYDSFLPLVTAAKICTYRTITALLAWMHDSMLEDLYDKVVHQKSIKPRVDGQYIECHIHEPMLFRESLDIIRVSPRELAPGVRNLRKAMGISEVEKNLRNFCERNHVRWEKADV
jgi:hypothetical protein